MGGRRVVVAGAFGADCVVEVEGLPGWGEDREARAVRSTPGGKGLNQAVAAARLGARVSAVGAVGDDAFGRAAVELLSAEGVDVDGIAVRAAATPLCVCFVGDSGKATYVSHTAPEVAVSPEMVRANAAAIGAADAVISTLEPRLPAVAEVIERGRKAGGLVVVQPAPMKPPRGEVAALPWQQVDLVVPNESEARAMLGDRASDLAPEELVKALSAQLGGPQVVITLAERGCIGLDGGTPLAFPAVEPTRVVDTTGASDAFTAALTVALTTGAPMRAAISAGLTAASHAVAHYGGPPSMPSGLR